MGDGRAVATQSHVVGALVRVLLDGLSVSELARGKMIIPERHQPSSPSMAPTPASSQISKLPCIRRQNAAPRSYYDSSTLLAS